MCFSPQASFGAAAALSVLGIVALKVKNRYSSQKALIAIIPLFFALQQVLEGFVWITLLRGDSTSWLHYIATYGFMFFAALWWPLYIPIILWYVEENEYKKKLLLYTIAAGTVVVIASAITLIYGGMYAEIIGHHISYEQYNRFPYNNFLYYGGLAHYLIATAGALCISSLRGAWIMGILVIIAFATTHLWYYYAFGSVWCFFAALCSGLILFMP